MTLFLSQIFTMSVKIFVEDVWNEVEDTGK